ncbi:MAG: twin-arginine translocase subunit TatC [Deltaproteobacteria bacterium]|nr:twin-arginine translocase subunit TatC [Deltaproteobacteria bacterium]
MDSKPDPGTEAESPQAEEQGGLTFMDHLVELRRRLIICALAVGVGFFGAYAVKEYIFEIMAWPLIQALPDTDHALIFTNLVEPFMVYLKLSFAAGIVLALPVIMHQVWMFIGPGLYSHEKRMIFPLVFLSCLFFAAGAAFGYFVVFPFGFKALIEFAGPSMSAFPSVKEYYGLVSKMLLVFGLIFELPLFISVFARFGLVTPAFLRKNRRYAILIIFVAAAILTPPDVFSQLLMALPLLVLYEAGILGAVIFGRAREKAEPPDPEPSPENPA